MATRNLPRLRAALAAGVIAMALSLASASTGAPESTDRAARGHGRMGRTARNNRQKEQH